MPKVTVIVPVYGVEKYIERCARSLFEQTLDDIEYIFINDCTKDLSIEILQSVLNEYPNRISQTKIISTPKNSGLPEVRKLGIQIAKGDFIIHCDSDDWVDTTMYKSMYLEATATASDIVICDFYKIDGENRHYIKACYHTNHDKAFMEMLIGKATWMTCNKLINRNLINKIKYYPTANTGEDLVLITQLMFNCKKISYVPRPFYFYMTNSNSITMSQTKQSIINRFEQSVANIKILQQFFSDENLSWKYKLALDKIKFHQRNFIGPLLHNKEYYKIWMKTFPHLLFTVWFNPYINIKQKIRFYLTALRFHK